jgi:hypothetical protein
MKSMSTENEEIQDDFEFQYIDFFNGAEVLKVLEKSFAEYEFPSFGRATQSRKWKRSKETGRLESRKSTPHEKSTAVFRPERVQQVISALSIGQSFESACASVGVSLSAATQWVARGKKEKKGPYWIFACAKDQIAAVFEAKLLGIATKFTTKSVRKNMEPTKEEAEMALKLLEKRYRKTWGQNVDVTTNGAPLPDGKVEMTVEFCTSDLSVGAGEITVVPESKE